MRIQFLRRFRLRIRQSVVRVARLAFIISSLAVAPLPFETAPALSQQIPGDVEWVPGELVYKLRAGSFASDAFDAALAAQGRTGLAALDEALALLQVSEIEAVFPMDATLAMDANLELKRSMGMDRVFLARYASSEVSPDAAVRLARLSEIEWVEPNRIVHGSLTPNDPTYTLQWGHRNRGQAVATDGDSVGTWDCDIDTNQAWDIQTGSFSVVLAIIDTGVDGGHPEFSGRMLSGWDFVNEDSDPSDDHGHGTSCAGIAAARGNNGQGVAGVAWGVRILPVKVLNSANGGNTTDLVQGIVYAADYGADVLSMSLGTGASQVLLDAVRYAFNLDCTMFAATGNANASSIDYPARYDEVIAVGALSPCNERKNPSSCDGEATWGSNYGTNIDLMAPGVRIHTTDIRGGGGFNPAGDYFATFNGTSAATPFAAGVAALVLSQTYLPRAQLLSVLTDSCDDLGTAGYDTVTGYGRINAYVALRHVSGGVFVGVNFGFEDGTYRFPYNTVTEGVNAVAWGNYVVVKPGNYDEATPWFVNKHVNIDAIDGGVTIR